MNESGKRDSHRRQGAMVGYLEGYLGPLCKWAPAHSFNNLVQVNVRYTKATVEIVVGPDQPHDNSM